ncbi:hypothetical protein QOZ95_000383 [Paenibacillus brasilensis]|uniref:Uncharacterized protein n=1 Tax=Paenibacillus brasilensis TaxID=128574 RepID=A0ABU0KV27_9BACL|nr:hypothetical protein [Paenibacillus brasilensis]
MNGFKVPWRQNEGQIGCTPERSGPGACFAHSGTPGLPEALG